MHEQPLVCEIGSAKKASHRENGLFTCINRYVKKVITQANDIEVNRLAKYPFDDYWSPLYSYPSHIQPQLHPYCKKEKE